MKKHPGGITLLELLIVIAIIGVLASIGVPSFRRVTQRARQAEAKVALGYVYGAESAFYSEYGFYTDNLGKIGIEAGRLQFLPSPPPSPGLPSLPSPTPDPTNQNLERYQVGFTETSCQGPWTIVPPRGTTQGNELEATMPSFYDLSTPRAAFGRRTLQYCARQGSPAVITSLVDVTSSGSYEYNQFLAAASGVIAPGVDLDNPAGAFNDLDIWTIDDQQELVNVQDGMK